RNYQNDGDLEAAILYNQKSLQLYEELGLLDQVACTLDNAALLYAEYGNRERASECLKRAASLAQETKRDGTLASIHTSEAEVLSKTDPEAGLAAAQEALKFARKVDQPDAQVRSLIIIGELRMASNPAAAKRSFQEASQLAEERVPHLLRVIFDRWSRAAEARGDSDEALRLARRARDRPHLAPSLGGLASSHGPDRGPRSRARARHHPRAHRRHAAPPAAPHRRRPARRALGEARVGEPRRQRERPRRPVDGARGRGRGSHPRGQRAHRRDERQHRRRARARVRRARPSPHARHAGPRLARAQAHRQGLRRGARAERSARGD